MTISASETVALGMSTITKPMGTVARVTKLTMLAVLRRSVPAKRSTIQPPAPDERPPMTPIAMATTIPTVVMGTS